jgi:ribosome biogenesis GTPase / thiamine phosphate phosphatase
MSNKLKKTGFNKSVQASVAPGLLEQYDLAQVVAVHKDSYIISNGEADIFAELVGKLIFTASSPTDFPAVGDWVLVNFYDENTFAIIHEVIPRKSLLKRKTPGKKIDFQLIAANIDVAFIIQSLNENFNLRRLERYLVLVNENNIQPIVLLSKSDLLTPEDIIDRINDIQKMMPDLQIIPFSNENKSGLDSVRDNMQPGLAYCLLGSSGVGKTTLINSLIGQSTYRTETVSKKESKGRHTTTHRQLTRLDCGAMVIDTPGMRELGAFSIDTGIEETFSEILALAVKCQFKDCTHIQEKGCAVLDAVEKGLLSMDRYHNYKKMSKESNYNKMSYLEKRKKDKKFGKHCKAVMKHKKSRR